MKSRTSVRTGRIIARLHPSPEGGGWSAKPTGWGQSQQRNPTRPLAPLAATLPLQGRDKQEKRAGVSPVNPIVQIAQYTRRHAPDVALAEGDGIIVPRHALPVAHMALHVGLIHQERQRHLEYVVDLRGVEREREAGRDARDHRNDAVTERGHVEVEIADRRHVRAGKADLLLRLAQRGGEWVFIDRVDLA